MWRVSVGYFLALPGKSNGKVLDAQGLRPDWAKPRFAGMVESQDPLDWHARFRSRTSL
jgi:hypothetical protein